MMQTLLKGGPGSGNHGHRGRNHLRGGSAKAWSPDAPISVVQVRPDALYAGDDLGGLRRAAIGHVRRLQEEIRAGAPLHNAATGWDWEISKADRDKLAKDYARTAVDLRAVANLRDLAAVAIRAESHADYKGNNQVRAVHRFYAPVLLGEKLFRLKLTVKDMTRGSRNLHCLQSLAIENPAVITPLLASLHARPMERQPAGLTVTVAQLLGDAKRQDGSMLLRAMSVAPDTLKKGGPGSGNHGHGGGPGHVGGSAPDHGLSLIEQALIDQAAPWRSLDYSAQAWALVGGADPLRKADIPDGARWITVFPNGRGNKGTPLLIQETPAGDGTYHVIGGAGGKLNYLRIRPSQDPAKAHEEAAARRKAKAAAKRERKAKEKALGTDKVAEQRRSQQRKDVRSQKVAHEQAMIDHVADAMGWKDHKFDHTKHPDLSDKALDAARKRHHREWLRRANAVVDRHKQALLHDADARARALGHDPLEASDAPLDVSDLGLAPTRKPSLGSRVNYTKEAEKRGASDEAIAREAKETAPEPDDTTIKRKASAERIAEELEGFRSGADDAPLEPDEADQAPDKPGGALDTEVLLGLVRAQKLAKNARKAASEANRKIDEDRAPKGAYHLAVSDVGMDEVHADLMNDLRTASTRAFLSELGERYGAVADRTLGSHMSAGAHGAINAVSLAVSGAALVDPMVVDTLGIAGAAQVLASKLQGQLTRDELDDLRASLGDYHADHYLSATQIALKDARLAETAANEIDIDAAATGADLETLKALVDRREEAAGKAQTLLGRTLGEMEANAALVAALGEGAAKGPLSVPIGRMSRADAIARARAIGLEPGDYQVHAVGQDQYLEVSEAGLGKLTEPMRKEDLERYRESRAILSGERDEPGWLPKGIANRPDLAMAELQPGVAQRLAEPFSPGPDLIGSIRDYIGGRAADGDAPADILADLHSSALADRSGNPAGYWKALDSVVPRTGPDGKPLLADAHASAFQDMADDFVARRHGNAQIPLHRQTIDVDAHAVDALHRTLAQLPQGRAAFTPLGDLTHADRRGLRQWWERNIASNDTRGQDLADALHAIESQEPPKTAPSLFGDDDPNPDWHVWKKDRDAKAAELNAAGLNWDRYVEGMGGPTKAMDAVQDLVRGEFSKRFAEHHNRGNTDSPLKIGRASIRGGLDHLDMIDPEARAQRQQQQRELIDDLRERDQGRYASGTVSDKLSAAAQSRAASAQSQVDLFGFDAPDEAAETPLAKDQRHTLGHAAERQLAGLVQHVGQNFRPGDQVKLWQPSMDGKYALGQRAIKFIRANKRVALGLGTGTGKAQPLDAVVLTPCGWKRMGDITVGDEVIAGDGSITRVLGVFPQGCKPIYRVTFDDGGKTECCDEHLWLTHTSRDRKNLPRAPKGSRDLYLPKVVSTEEIRSSLMARGGKVRNHAVPLAPAVQLPDRALPLAPYLLGVLLGDGGMSQSFVMLSNPEREVAQKVLALLPDGVHMRKKSEIEYYFNGGKRREGIRAKNVLVQSLAGLGLMGKLSSEKFIPTEYLFASSEQRLELLRGLMDTDGTVDNRCGAHCTFCTSAPGLRDGVVALVRSLGGRATVSIKADPKYRHKGEPKIGKTAYIVTVNMPPNVNPFFLPRKANAVTPKSKYRPRHRLIDSVEYVGEKEAQCILVDHPSHLYITDDFIVTHNTLTGLGAFTDLHATGDVKKGLFVVPSSVQGQFHCVSGDTVLEDPVRQVSWTFAEWSQMGEAPFVLSLDMNGGIALKLASVPFIKGTDAMYRVTTEGGAEIVVTGRHRFLTPNRWAELGSLAVGSHVFAGGKGWHEVVDAQTRSLNVDSQGDCHLSRRSHGVQPRLYAETGQCVPPSQVCALEHSRENLPRDDVSRSDGCNQIFEQDDLRANYRFLPDGAEQSERCCEDLAYGVAIEQLTCRDGQVSGLPSIAQIGFLPPKREVDLRPIDTMAVSQTQRQESPRVEELSHLMSESDAPKTLQTSLHLLTDEILLRQSGALDALLSGHAQDQGSLAGQKCTCGFCRMLSPSMLRCDLLLPISEGRRHQRQEGLMLLEASSLHQGSPALRLRETCIDDCLLPSGTGPHQACGVAHAGQTVSSGSLVCFWDTISSIEYVGEQDVYDIHVPDTHNYFAHGVLNHNSEALRYLDPGKYKWHAKPGASREERLAAMRDPDTHFVVTTHQALRNDLLHLGAKAEGISESEMATRLNAMEPMERKQWAGRVLDAHAIRPDFVMADEAHGALNRQGKENSALANVLDAVGHNATHHVLASADPVKNDISEAADLMAKLNPERYGDRDAFIRRYGGDTQGKKDALRREITPYLMTGHNTPDVKVTKREVSVPVGPKHAKALADIGRHVAAVRLGRIKGKPDIAALKALSPGAFDGQPQEDHPRIAQRLQTSIGVLKESAMRRVLDGAQSPKLDALSDLANERKGQPGVVFAHSLDAAKAIHERLTKDGHRSALLTGANSAAERDTIRQGFNPEQGEAKHDILVMSDAGAVGINAQRGRWLAQYDSPVTAMGHAQRQGRINRLGQQNDVELIDLVADHPAEHRARERLRTKYGLREIMTDPTAGLDDTGVAGYLSRRQAARESAQGGLF